MIVQVTIEVLKSPKVKSKKKKVVNWTLDPPPPQPYNF